MPWSAVTKEKTFFNPGMITLILATITPIKEWTAVASCSRESEIIQDALR